MTWTPVDILVLLGIVVAVVLLIVLYHVLFIVVDLRKTMRRLEVLTNEVEEIVMKPLSMVDQAFDWLIGAMNKPSKKSGKDWDTKEI